MGILTQDDLKSEIRASLGNRSDTDTRLTAVMNMIQDTIVRKAAAKKVNFTELQGTKTFNITVGLQEISYESIEAGLRIRNIYDLRIVQTANTTDSSKLLRVEPSKMDEMIPDTLRYAQGRPTIYVPWENKLEFYAIPDITYNMVMRVSKWCTAFVEATGTQTSDLDGKDDAIIFGTLHYLYHSLGERDAGKMYFAKFENAMGDSTQENEAENDSQIVGVIDPHGRRGYSAAGSSEYWNNPFIVRVR